MYKKLIQTQDQKVITAAGALCVLAKERENPLLCLYDHVRNFIMVELKKYYLNMKNRQKYDGRQCKPRLMVQVSSVYVRSESTLLKSLKKTKQTNNCPTKKLLLYYGLTLFRPIHDTMMVLSGFAENLDR